MSPARLAEIRARLEAAGTLDVPGDLHDLLAEVERLHAVLGQRYIRVTDSEGRHYACPLEIEPEFYLRDGRTRAYWEQGDPGGTPPPAAEDLPGVMRWDGVALSFLAPREETEGLSAEEDVRVRLAHLHDARSRQ